MKNEIDQTVERIGGYIQECRSYGNTRTLSHEEFAALENLFTAYTQLKADLATAKQGLEHYDAGRHYLMGVDPDALTVEDALEAFGFGRNGLGKE